MGLESGDLWYRCVASPPRARSIGDRVAATWLRTLAPRGESGLGLSCRRMGLGGVGSECLDFWERTRHLVYGADQLDHGSSWGCLFLCAGRSGDWSAAHDVKETIVFSVGEPSAGSRARVLCDTPGVARSRILGWGKRWSVPKHGQRDGVGLPTGI